MAPTGLFVLACALIVAAPASGSEKDTVAVQAAMWKGRDFLSQGDAKSAVRVLEAQLPHINGNGPYLVLLRDAYRKHLMDLLAKNDQPAEIKKYRERLAILDPDAARDRSLRTAAPASIKAVPSVRPRKEDDPFHAANQSKDVLPTRPEVKVAPTVAGERRQVPARVQDDHQRQARKLVEQAVAAFARKDYSRAGLLFDRASRSDPKAVESNCGAWAYCKLHRVDDNLDRREQDRPSWAELEGEVQAALKLAPHLNKTGKWLLEEIAKRKSGAGSGEEGSKANEVAINVQHFGRNAQGWYVAETPNFRIYHNQSRALVEKAAQVAEQTRLAMSRKWFGKPGEEWNPKCNLFLHADGKEYSHHTGVSASSPGHSRIESQEGRVTARRVDVHCDNPAMLKAVLPHETTHVVLAGQFGKHAVPRWADEGMAVLTEPTDKLALHRRNLQRCQDDGNLFPVRELMLLDDYPQPRRIGAFYAQSVSLVDFLARKRGAVVFARFLNDALKDGYETALRKHYSYRTYADLQASWSRHAFGSSVEQASGKKTYR